MPRPKQSRATRMAQTAVAAQQTRQNSTSSDLYGHSDREQERLRQETAIRPRRSSSRIRPTSAAASSHVLERAANRRDSAISRLQDSDIVTSSSDRAAKHGPAAVLGHRKLGVVSGTPLRSNQATDAECELDSLGDINNSFDLSLGGGEDDTEIIEHEEATRGRSLQAAPSTVDNFQPQRRRQRSSSIIGPGDAPIRPSSHGSRTRVSAAFNIGAFRRRVREPSILGAARKRRHSETEADDGSSEDLGAGDSGVTDYDESLKLSEVDNTTPKASGALRTSIRADSLEQSAKAGQLSTTSRDRKRKSTNDSVIEGRSRKSIRVSSSRRGTRNGDSIMEKRDVAAMQVANAGPPSEAIDKDDDSSDVSSIASPLSPPPLPPMPGRSVAPIEADSATAAPPESSDDGEDLALPDVHALARRRRRLSHSSPLQYKDTAVSEPSSPPSLTHSPNIRPGKKAFGAGAHKNRTVSRKPVSPKFKTSDLTSLLPKRSRRGDANGGGEDEERDEFDMSDDDVSESDARCHKARRVTGGHKQRPAPAPKHKHPLSNDRRTSNKGRTYGSRRASNKEIVVNGNNADDAAQDDDFEDTTMTDDTTVGPGEELRKAIIKFKEVDQWPLEFEAVSSPSQSQSDAR